MKDLENAVECFVTGTAAEIVPVQSLKTGLGEEKLSLEFKYGKDSSGPVTAKILSILREIMYETRELTGNTKGWLPDPFSSAEDFRNLK